MGEKKSINASTLNLAFCLLLLLFIPSLPTVTAAENPVHKTYIICVRKISSIIDHDQWYRSFLRTLDENLNNQRMIYSFKSIITGFAARLTEEEVAVISSMPGFISANPDRRILIQTTHTPSFLGLIQDTPGNASWKGLGGGEGIVIGVLDSGVFPDHPSFSGKGMPPPPAKWKGRCDFNSSQCNNKLIGARTFLRGAATAKGQVELRDGRVPPFDKNGHGTHTASTAAGAMVEDAQVLGNAKGVATGMAPRAHLAIYKVCPQLECFTSDILAGMEAAIEDGVDVLSLSLGSESISFFQDEVAIAAFRAIDKGIFVSCAAGNSGPVASTLSNEAPWILTVAASSTDRSILAEVKLGNGLIFSGESLFQPSNFIPRQLPLVYAGQGNNSVSAFCGNGSLDRLDVKGKMVVCDGGGNISSDTKANSVKAAGGAAMILVNGVLRGNTVLANVLPLPASEVSFYAGSKIKAYIASSRTPTASIIFQGTVLGASPAPAMAAFSSRGPSIASPGILKPDITGPGHNILAAWPFSVGPPTSKPFNIISGTSMSTLHLTGIAALIKSAHPDWSPAAIKSAMMTTAYILDRNKRPIVDQRGLSAGHFTLGAGHVNPIKAVNPGLVYDSEIETYTPYLCGLNYTSAQVGAVTGKQIDCSKIKNIIEAELNYPSVLVSLGRAEEKVTIWRMVKNVGEATVDYVVKVDEPKGVVVVVELYRLSFNNIGEEKSFALTFRGRGNVGEIAEGRITWVSSKYEVSSPITVTFKA